MLNCVLFCEDHTQLEREESMHTDYEQDHLRDIDPDHYEGSDPDLAKKRFDIQAPFEPAGDQPTAITELVEGLRAGEKHQVLLGATGTGKTHTIARVIQEVQRPTLLIAHNKTLAAQLYNEFKDFSPDNAVEYFVSYYD